LLLLLLLPPDDMADRYELLVVLVLAAAGVTTCSFSWLVVVGARAGYFWVIICWTRWSSVGCNFSNSIASFNWRVSGDICVVSSCSSSRSTRPVNAEMAPIRAANPPAAVSDSVDGSRRAMNSEVPVESRKLWRFVVVKRSLVVVWIPLLLLLMLGFG